MTRRIHACGFGRIGRTTHWDRLRHTPVFPLFSLVLILVLTAATRQSAAQILIDDFTEGPYATGSFSAGTVDNGTQTGLPTDNVIGGSRFLSGTVENNVGDLNMNVGVVTADIDRYFYANDPGVNGFSTLRFDANGNGLNFDASMATGLELQFGSNDFDVPVTVTLTDGNGNMATATMTNAANGMPSVLTFDIADFDGVDLSDIDSVEFLFDPETDTDFVLNMMQFLGMFDMGGGGGPPIFGSTPQVGFIGSTFLFNNLANRLRNLPQRPAGKGKGKGGHGHKIGDFPSADGDGTLTERPVIVRGQNHGLGLWDGWATGYGMGGNVAGDGAVSGLGYASGGSQVGMYRYLNSGTVAGMFVDYNHLYVDHDEARETATGDGVRVGGFLLHGDECGNYGLASVFGGYTNYDTVRDLDNSTATGHFDGWGTGVYLERGLTRNVHCRDVQPFVALQHVWLHQNDFTETGAGSANLQIDDIDAHSLRGIIGGRIFGLTRPFHRGHLTPILRGYYAHEFLDTNTAYVGTLTGTGAGFAARGLDFGRDWAGVGGTLVYTTPRGCNIYGNYDTMFNDRAAFHYGGGGLLWLW